MEQHLCEVCATPYDTGAILLDRKLKQSLERNTITAMEGLCPECQKLYDDGFIALVGVRGKWDGRSIKHSEADRSGEIIHLKDVAYEGIFGQKPTTKMVYCEQEVIEALKKKKEEVT
mgnify:FL=1